MCTVNDDYLEKYTGITANKNQQNVYRNLLKSGKLFFIIEGVFWVDIKPLEFLKENKNKTVFIFQGHRAPKKIQKGKFKSLLERAKSIYE